MTREFTTYAEVEHTVQWDVGPDGPQMQGYAVTGRPDERDLKNFDTKMRELHAKEVADAELDRRISQRE